MAQQPKCPHARILQWPIMREKPPIHYPGGVVKTRVSIDGYEPRCAMCGEVVPDRDRPSGHNAPS